ncbi:hypothetical protein BGX21_004134 [Mortierella sp. AD011]|nr:hypothetical protein BGX20_004546 [Mortierella sp. AD010]KAF9400512.1 hypothetical protein BGX21_004134 [Mortierella sp. AD011]
MAGGRYPYPKHVWSPSGGWWTQPTNWKSNTAVAVGITAAIVAGAWKYSAENEWAKEFRDGEVFGKK